MGPKGAYRAHPSGLKQYIVACPGILALRFSTDVPDAASGRPYDPSPSSTRTLSLPPTQAFAPPASDRRATARRRRRRPCAGAGPLAPPPLAPPGREGDWWWLLPRRRRRGGASGDGAASDPLRRAAVRHGARAQHPVPHRPGRTIPPSPAFPTHLSTPAGGDLFYAQACRIARHMLFGFRSQAAVLQVVGSRRLGQGFLGYVGNKSAVFPLQLLGFDVDPINSVQFSNHTGYPTFRGQVLNGNQLWDLIEGLEENDLLHYTHLLTGYIGSVSFLNTVLQVVDKLRSVNPDLIYVCDPVLGDEGKLYVPQELISVYQQKVVPVASMLTPNQFEVELLTGLRITSEQDGLKACNTLHSAGPQKVVITSALIEDKLLLIGSHKKTEEQHPEQFKIEIPKIPSYFTGTGDLTTALLLGWSNKYPNNLERAAELAVSSLQALLRRTVEDYKRVGFDPSTSSLEIRLIQSQDDIRSPQVTCKAVKYG